MPTTVEQLVDDLAKITIIVKVVDEEQIAFYFMPGDGGEVESHLVNIHDFIDSERRPWEAMTRALNNGATLPRAIWAGVRTAFGN